MILIIITLKSDGQQQVRVGWIPRQMRKDFLLAFLFLPCSLCAVLLVLGDRFFAIIAFGCLFGVVVVVTFVIGVVGFEENEFNIMISNA